jgi:hypothetical protein
VGIFATLRAGQTDGIKIGTLSLRQSNVADQRLIGDGLTRNPARSSLTVRAVSAALFLRHQVHRRTKGSPQGWTSLLSGSPCYGSISENP